MTDRDTALARAKALLGTDPRAARELALAAGPGIEARFVAAAAMRRCGDAAGALALLQPIGATRAWGIQFERGAAFATLRRASEAIAALQTALDLNPAAAITAHALGGELVLADQPVPPLVLAAVAAVRHPNGAFAHAALQGAPLPGLDRNDPLWLRLLADAASGSGAVDEAEALLQAALVLAPGLDPVAFDLAALFERQQRGPEAAALLRPLAGRYPHNPVVLALLSAAELHSGAVAAALAASAQALAAVPAQDHPQQAQLWHARGHALRVAGQRDDAVAAYRRALELAPDQTEPWWSLANLKAGTLGPGDRAAMARLCTADLPEPARAHLCFAQGHAALEAGDWAEAMDHLATGNAIRHRAVPFAMADHARFVEAAIGTFDAAFFAAREGWGNPAPGPLFIVGMPRAGSTLAEQVLASHPAIEGLSELPDLAVLARQATARIIREGRAADRVSALAAVSAAEAEALGTAYLERIAPRRQTGRAWFVDKAPGNLFNLALVRIALPGARIIDVRRDAMACCFSLYTQDFAAGQGYSYDQAQLGTYYRLYEHLADHCAAQLPGRMIQLRHEDLIADLPAAVHRLLALCGLPFAEACLRFHQNPRPVRTISSEQVRQPLDPARGERWRPCAPWLGPLAAALAQPR